MKHRIVNLEAFSIAGIREFVSLENCENLINIPKIWASLPDETFEELRKLSNLEPSGVLGVSANINEKGMDYWIAAATNERSEKFEKLDIPASQWLVFEVKGAMPKAIQDGFAEIFGGEFPDPDYQQAEAPCIEWYSFGDMTSPEYKSEIWIPVIKISE